MANHSVELPEDSLTKQQLMSFFSITGTTDNFVHTPGHERSQTTGTSVQSVTSTPSHVSWLMFSALVRNILLFLALADIPARSTLSPLLISDQSPRAFLVLRISPKVIILSASPSKSRKAAFPDILGGSEIDIGDLTQI